MLTEPSPLRSCAPPAAVALLPGASTAPVARIADTRVDPPIDGAALVEAHLPVINRAIAFVSRQHRLSRDAAQELASDVYLRLLQHNANVLRTYRGESSLRTFLVVVIRRVLLDAQIARAGKWRPSTDASRLGQVAVQLERLVFYEGLALQEAAPILRQRLGATHTDDELHFLLMLLPARARRRMVGERELEHVRADNPDPERRLLDAAAAPDVPRLARALATLRDDDRRLIGLRFGKGLRLCEIARLRRIDEKRIYRRFEQALAALREAVTPGAATPRRHPPSRPPAPARR